MPNFQGRTYSNISVQNLQGIWVTSLVNDFENFDLLSPSFDI